MPNNLVFRASMLAAIALVTILTGSRGEDLEADDEHRASHDSGANDRRESSRSTGKTFAELVTAEGYDFENHNVMTEDNYTVAIHRIPGGTKSPRAPEKQPILLMHGLFGASDVWVMRGPEHSLAYKLVDSGYDVWALNVRGNFYSKRHSTLSPDESKFWRFSWHEFGFYDLAASIDHILSRTKMQKISLVGHSMGTTMELVLLSTRPDYNDKVNVAVLLAPVAITNHHVPGLVTRFFIIFGGQIQAAVRVVGGVELFPRDGTTSKYFRYLCKLPELEMVCKEFLSRTSGLVELKDLDMSTLLRAAEYYPQGTSIETILHYAQIGSTRHFTHYDFGMKENVRRYRNPKPPEYPLNKITAPVEIYYSLNDPYSTKEDVQELLKKMPHVNAIPMEIFDNKFGHLDFILHEDVGKLVNDRVVGILNRYRHGEFGRIDNDDLAYMKLLTENRMPRKTTIGNVSDYWWQ